MCRLLPLPHELVHDYGVAPEIAMMAHRPLLRAFEAEAAREAAKLTGASAAAAGGPEEGELESEEEGALPEEGEGVCWCGIVCVRGRGGVLSCCLCSL